jgi:mycothiol synthase
MALGIRSFTWKDDFELVRAFLIRTYKATHSLQNWIPSRFENVKFGPCGPEYRDEDDEYIKIWRKTDDDIPSGAKMVAVTFCEPSGDCWIQIDPSHRSNEREIVLWMETQSRKMERGENPERKLRFYVDERDETRQALLAELGYEDTGFLEYNRTRLVDQPIPDCQLPSDFTVRSVDIEKDFIQYKKVQAAAFPHCGCMTERTAKIYSTASFYHPDLDLVAVDGRGNFAAFCTVRIDPVSRMAELEPVGTHPDYRRRGLARSVICEGLRRLRKYNPSLICIQGAAATDAANRLYDSVGFTRKTEVHTWRKTL